MKKKIQGSYNQDNPENSKNKRGARKFFVEEFGLPKTKDHNKNKQKNVLHSL